MTAFPSLGITDMDIVQALLCVLIYLAWRLLTPLQSAGKKVGEFPEIASQLESLASVVESKVKELALSLKSIEALLMNIGTGGQSGTWNNQHTKAQQRFRAQIPVVSPTVMDKSKLASGDLRERYLNPRYQRQSRRSAVTTPHETQVTKVKFVRTIAGQSRQTARF